MKKIRRWLIILCSVILITSTVFLAVRNFHTVSFDMFVMHIELPLILLLLSTFLFGVFFAWLLNAWLLFTQKQKIKQLNKQLADYKQELSQLRQTPMSGM